MVHDVYVPPGPEIYCRTYLCVLFSSYLVSTSLVGAMTFDRFYSIVAPHKAASFNTVKRAKITVACITIASIIYNLPHYFLTSYDRWECIPYKNAKGNIFGEIYYWLSMVVQFILPFVVLLSLNSIIIHKIRNRFALAKKLCGIQIKVKPKLQNCRYLLFCF